MMNNCNICGCNKLFHIFDRDGQSYYKCSFCALEKIYLQPSDLELNQIYDDKYYEAWGLWKGDQVNIIKKETFRRRLNLIPKRKNVKILDCGSATGSFLELAKEYGYLPYGIEINKEAISIAVKKNPADQIYFGDMENYSFKEESFYAIFMNDFLEHVKDPAKIMQKVFRLLESNGYLIITTPNTNSFSHKLMGKSWVHYKTEHLFYFNPSNLSLLLKKYGFRLISIKKAWKSLTPDYIKSIFVKYPRKGTTFFLKKLIDALPNKLKFKKIWLYFGEMTIIAQKP